MPTEQRGRQAVLDYLAANDGELYDAAGRGVTRRIAEALGYKLDSLGRLLADMERDGQITRDVRGKRTYRVAVVPAGKSGFGDEYQRLRAVLKLLDEVRALRVQMQTKENQVRDLLGGVLSDMGGLDIDEVVERLAARLVEKR